jgi:hypothetical protein
VGDLPMVRTGPTSGDARAARLASSTGNDLEIWGLTGWFLSVFMWRMGFWRSDVGRDGDGGRVLDVEQPGSDRPTSRM